MSFASWLTITRNLPDAQVGIVCTRATGGNFFSWCRQCKVPFQYHAEREGPRKLWQAQYAVEIGMLKTPMFVIEPDVLAIREISREFPESVASDNDKLWFCKDKIEQPLQRESGLCPGAKGDDFTTFVNYADGWGKFVTTDCINRRDYPFRRAERFHSGSGMTLNEGKVLDLWKRMDRLFTAVSRG
jgi:hypothetical protein